MLPIRVVFHEIFPSDEIPSFSSEVAAVFASVPHLQFEFREPVFKKMREVTHKHLVSLRNWDLQRPMFQLTKVEKPVFQPYSKENIYDLFDYICAQNSDPEHDTAIKILLIHNKNEQNWFSDYNARKRVGFVQVSDWGTHVSVNPAKAIAFEALCVIFRILAMPDKRAYLRFGHNTPAGCINEHCPEKSAIIAKLRGADLCDSCMRIIQKSEVNPLLLETLFAGLQAIRLSIFEEKEFIKSDALSLDIYLNSRILHFPELDLKLKPDPAEFALFVLIISSQEGIEKASLENHKEELLQLYQNCSKNTEDRARKTIMLLCDPSDNSFNEKLSRLTRKLKKSLLRFAAPFVPVNTRGRYTIGIKRGKVRYL